MTPDRIRRLTACLHHLRAQVPAGTTHLPRVRLAAALGCDPLVLRDDLAALGVRGRPRLGLEVAAMTAAIEALLGWSEPRDAVLVGTGHLGRAFLGHPGFAAAGLAIAAAFDTDQRLIGQVVNGHTVQPMSRLAGLVQRLGVRLGILALPPFSAPAAARTLYDAGVRGIWNLTGAELHLPADAAVESLDLGAALAGFMAAVERRRRPPRV